MPVLSTKPCRKCGGTKRYKNRRCAVCSKANGKSWRAADPEREKERSAGSYEKNKGAQYRAWLLARYNLTLAEYNDQLAAQGGVCAICRRPETAKRNGKVRALVVDHCHETGTLRGILCNRCNSVIGYFDDDPEFFTAAAAYLKAVIPDPAAHGSPYAVDPARGSLGSGR